MKGDASNIYKWVVDDVVAAMAPEFQAANVDESVLNELKQKWEEKLKQQGLIRDEHDVGDDLLMAQMQRAGAVVDDGGDDDDDDDGPGTSYLGKRKQPDSVALPHVLTAHNPALQAAQQYFAAFTQHLQQQTLQLHQQQQLQQHQQQLQLQQQLQQQQHQLQQQQQQQQQQLLYKQEQVQQHHQHPQQQLQHHGAPAAAQPQLVQAAVPQRQPHIAYYPPGVIPQRDGDGDDAAPAADESAAGTSAGAEGEAPPEGDEVLSEDEHDENEEDEVVENLMIGQFEKVNKMKNRWKVAMRDCVFHINGRDFLFKKCTAEFSWQ